MASGSFRIEGSSANFASKRDSVFSALGELEKQHEDWAKSDAKKDQPCPQKEEPVILRDSEFSIPRSRTQLDRRSQQRSLALRSPTSNLSRRLQPSEQGRQHDDNSSHRPQNDGQFRRPNAIPPARRLTKVPDYRMHPERWTKYTLDSVSEGDMSDRSNTAAAMSFLKEQSSSSAAAPIENSVDGSKDAAVGDDEHGGNDGQDNTRSDQNQLSSFVVSFRKRPCKRPEMSTAPKAELSEGKLSAALRGRQAAPQAVAAAAAGTGEGVIGSARAASAAPCTVMPEHVVGASAGKSRLIKRPMGPRSGCGDRVNLSYLGQVDDGDDGEPKSEDRHDKEDVNEEHNKESMSIDDSDHLRLPAPPPPAHIQQRQQQPSDEEQLQSSLTAPEQLLQQVRSSETAVSGPRSDSGDASSSTGTEEAESTGDANTNSKDSCMDLVPPVMKRRKFRGNARTRMTDQDDD